MCRLGAETSKIRLPVSTSTGNHYLKFKFRSVVYKCSKIECPKSVLTLGCLKALVWFVQIFVVNEAAEIKRDSSRLHKESI